VLVDLGRNARGGTSPLSVYAIGELTGSTARLTFETVANELAFSSEDLVRLPPIHGYKVSGGG
jgi:hypothetical protein